jgi:TonB-dependent receptor
MKRISFGCLAAILLLLLGSSTGLAQTGTLVGTVIDEDFSEGVIGANVSIAGTELGAVTDLDGNYRIANIPIGTYEVVFSYIGFATQRITGVEITAGETERIDVTLGEDVQVLGEVVVEARLIRNNEAALLRDRQNAAAVSDAISAETISKSGASDAADAMERVTGASVVGGKFVVVRGLGDRYSNTQLNGASVPTADPDRRSVQFDLFPSNLLENIVTLKTFTADQPGNFSGGLVDIRTKSFPDDFELRFSASSGFDTQTQFQDEFLTTSGGGLDLLAMDDGTRELPDFLNQPLPAFNPRRARTDPVQAQQLNDVARAFGQTFDLRRAEGPINQSYAASLGNRHDFGRDALGYVLSLNWGRSAGFYDEGRVERYTFNARNPETGELSIRPQLLLEDSRGTEEVSWGGIANFTYRLGARNEFGLNSLYSRSAEQEARLLQGFFPEQFDSSRVFVDRALAYTERDLYSVQLRGRHQFPALAGATAEWNGTIGRNTIDEPDQRFFANTINTLNRNGEIIRAYNTSVVGVNGQSRFFRSTEEDVTGGKLDLTVPATLASRPVQIKFGGRYDRTTRTATERRFNYQFDDIEFGAGEDGLGDVAGVFGQIGVTDTTRFDAQGNPTRFQIGAYIVDESRQPLVLGNNYDGELEVLAGYGQVEAEPFERLRVILGARYETTDQNLLTQQVDSTIISAVTGDTTIVFTERDNSTRDWLPSLNLVYALTDNMNLRGAATRTLARPTFLELSPGARLDFGLGEIIQGADLDRTLITNYDLRWEWFTAPGDIVALSGYHKDFTDPIERIFLGNNGILSYRNVDQAEVYGLEFEARQSLSRLLPALSDTPVLRNLNAGFNASLIRSSISIDSLELAQRRGVDPDAPDSRELQGQSPYILNADLAYENLETGTNLGVYFNVFGRRLSRVSLGGTPDIYEEAVPQLDFTASQRLPGQFSLKLAVKNILGADFEEVYNLAAPGGGEAFFSRRNRPTSFSIGLSYSPRFGGGPPAAPAIPDSDSAGGFGS